MPENPAPRTHQLTLSAERLWALAFDNIEVTQGERGRLLSTEVRPLLAALPDLVLGALEDSGGEGEIRIEVSASAHPWQ